MNELLAVSPDGKKKLYKTRNGDSVQGHWGLIEDNDLTKQTEEPLLEILRKSKTDWIPADEDSASIIDPLYLPFTAKTVDEHLARPQPGAWISTDEKSPTRDGVAYYQKSARRYRLFKATGVSPESLGLSRLRKPCQIEKDERFWTAASMLRAFQTNRFPNLLESAFGSRFSPVDGADWNGLVGTTAKVWLEAPLRSPRSYTEFLSDQYRKPRKASGQFGLIPYVRAAAGRSISRLEGFTHADCVIEDNAKRLRVIFEAKATADMSTDVSFDPLRNQIARNIDAGLLGDASADIERGHAYFVLVTPELFRRQPESRLYGWIMAEYTHPVRGVDALKRALPHRDDVTDQQWESVRRRLAWITWEECTRAVPGACPWLEPETDPS